MLTLSLQLLSPPRHAPSTIATHGRLARHSPCLFVGFADAPMARRALEDGTGTSSTALIAARGTHSHHCSQALARGKGWQGVLRPQGRKAARLRGRPRGCDTARRRCGTPARLGHKAARRRPCKLWVCEAVALPVRGAGLIGPMCYERTGLLVCNCGVARPQVRGGCACTRADVPLHPHTELRCAGKQHRAKGIRGKERASGTSPEALNFTSKQIEVC